MEINEMSEMGFLLAAMYAAGQILVLLFVGLICLLVSYLSK